MYAIFTSKGNNKYGKTLLQIMLSKELKWSFHDVGNSALN